MERATSQHVDRYFELQDRLVTIRVWDERRDRLAPPAGRDGASLRRAIVEACVAAREVPREPAELDELYDLVVAVNPCLRLERLTLGRAEPEGQRPRARSAAADASRLARRTRGLRARLARRIHGQEDALDGVTRAMQRAAAGLARAAGPRAGLLFVGPTGTGKTELARALAKELLGPGALVRIDCSEFAEGHEYAKLLGAPPGFVGHGEDGLLARALAQGGPKVVLFDEIEKAHRRLHNLLLQVLEEGELHDGRGRCLDLRECIVVLTSNAGSDEIERAADGLGFGGRSLARNGAEEIARNALRRSFPPELLGRVDETIVFRALSPADARAIAADQLTDLARRARRSGVRVRLSSAVARWVAERGYDEAHGARGIARIVRSAVEGPLSEAILERSADGPRWFAVTIAGGRPRVRAAD